MMKIFLVHKDIYNAGNPYIYTLRENIEKHFPNVTFGWGEDIYWSDKLLEYDIVHFHWPAAFLDCDSEHHSLEEFCEQIVKCKKSGVKIVSTCHDLCPHYTQGAEFAGAITYVYENSDAIFHLGEYSKSLFEKQFPNCKHLILPHHLYDELYTNIPTKIEARNRLQLNLNKHYVLCMGAFRAEEERKLVEYLAKKLKNNNVEFIAPAFNNVNTTLKKKFPFISKSLLKYWYYKYICKIHLTGKSWVPITDEDLPYYYAACDLAFVQRIKILNSGNAVMPLLFSTPVCGPDVANVGPFLKEYGGLVYDINDREALVKMIRDCLKTDIVAQNSLHEKAMREISTTAIAKLQYQYYCKIS